MSYPPPQQPGDWGAPQPGSGYPQGAGYDPQQAAYAPQQPGYDPQQAYPPPGPDPYGQGGDPYGQRPPADPYTAPGFGPDPYGQPPMDGSPPHAGSPMSSPPGANQSWAATPATPATRSGFPIWFFVVGAVVMVVILAAGGFLVWQTLPGGDAGGSASDGGSSQSESQQDDGQESQPEPDSGLITDSVSGLSYPTMDSWGESNTFQMPGFTSTTGQQLETEPSWVAMMLVGEIDVATTGYTDLESAPDVAEAISKQIEEAAYSVPGTEEQLEGFDSSEPTTEELSLAGTDAFMYSYDVTWDDSTVDAEGERIVVGILDRGDGTAAGFLTTLPDNMDDTARDESIAAVEELSFE